MLFIPFKTFENRHLILIRRFWPLKTQFFKNVIPQRSYHILLCHNLPVNTNKH